MGAGNWYLSCNESKLVYVDVPFSDVADLQSLTDWHNDQLDFIIEKTRSRLESIGFAVEACDEWARDGQDDHKIRLVVSGRYGTSVGLTFASCDNYTAFAVADYDEMSRAENCAYSNASWLVEHTISAAVDCCEFAKNFGCQPQTFINETHRMIDLVYTELIVAMDEEVSRKEIRLRTGAWTTCVPSNEWFITMRKASQARRNNFTRRIAKTSQQAIV